MTVQQGAMLYTQSFGSRPENVEIPTIQSRNPLTTDTGYPQGKVWINQALNTVFCLTSFSTSVGVVSANWAQTSN